VVDAGVEEDVLHDVLVQRRAAEPVGQAAEPPPVVGHRAAPVGDHQPEAREVTEEVALHQLHEGRGVGVEVVRAQRVEVRVARRRDVDHCRDVELHQRLVKGIPIGVGQRLRRPEAAGRIGVEVAAHEPEVLNAPAELGDRVVERAARGLRQLADADEVLGKEADHPMDQVVAGTRPGQRGRRVADVMLHAGCPGREEHQVAAALAQQLQLVVLDALADGVVADVGRGRLRPAEVGQAGQLGVPERLVSLRRGRVVPVALDDHGLSSGASTYVRPLAASCSRMP
jgi:hypothetical protein